MYFFSGFFFPRVINVRFEVVSDKILDFFHFSCLIRRYSLYLFTVGLQ